jgi:hypothetical protein
MLHSPCIDELSEALIMRMSITRFRNSHKGGHGHDHVMQRCTHPGLDSQAGFCANTQNQSDK